MCCLVSFLSVKVLSTLGLQRMNPMSQPTAIASIAGVTKIHGRRDG
jgi:hypothetical protein